MHPSPAARSWQPTYKSIAIAFLTIGGLLAPCSSKGADANRIWVDADGRFSVEATMIGVDDHEVVLLRADGGEITIAIDKLSDRDQEYLEEYQEQAAKSNDVNNPLRLAPPKPPAIKPLPALRLPPATRVADDGSVLMIGEATTPRLPSELPGSIAADRVRQTFAVAKTRIPIFKVDSHDICSRPLPITTLTDSGTRKTSIAMSVSRGLWIPGETPRHQLIRFDVDDGKAFVALDHDSTILLLDHHPASGRSLLLTGHNSLGEGGELSIGTRWDNRGVKLSLRRQLSKSRMPGERPPHVRWARWVDEEHFLAVIDQTLGMWNIVSGEQVYRLDGIHQRAEPAISGGRRYVAVPYQGCVQLFDTRTGQALGRIGVENQVPAVSFSPHGDKIAIVTTRRLRTWDLASASLSADVESRRSLGKDRPIWIDSDLILSGTGVLMSAFRGLPIWRYDLASSESVSVGKNVVMFRKQPVSELSIVSLPHDGAANAMEWIDHRQVAVDNEKWRTLGRSVWNTSGWVDRDVQIGALQTRRR